MENEPKFTGNKMKLPTEKLTKVGSDYAHNQTRGAFIILLIVALILISIGMFYWYKTASNIPVVTPTPLRPTTETNKEPETPTATAQVESFGAMSTSDEINAIEADIESTNLDSLESEMSQIDAELKSAN